MLSLEKILNELTLISTLVTMTCVFLLKYEVIKWPLLVFMCLLTALLYLSSRIVNSNNSKISDEEKENLRKISKRIKKERK